jgi:peptidoglycan/xylan/chitin deacetylase (PgdA/CDA1 family)
MPLILLYHDVVQDDDDSSGFPGGGAARYKLGRAEFASHLDAIARVVEPGSGHAIEDPDPSSATGPVFAFDDGGVSAFDVIAGDLESRGWRGYFFVTVDYIGTKGFLDNDQIRDLARRGHVIGSHSCSHPTRMAACPRPQLLDEWKRSCDTLSEIIGARVTTASVPGGYYSRTVAETAAEAGIGYLFNSEPTTRVQEVDGCRVFGRYTIYRGMTAPMAAALASRSMLALWKQTATWEMKKVVKSVGGRAYLGVRQAILNRKYARSGSN